MIKLASKHVQPDTAGRVLLAPAAVIIARDTEDEGVLTDSDLYDGLQPHDLVRYSIVPKP